MQLYQIEQAIAQRCGPFLADIAVSGTVNDVTIASQQSTLALGDQWKGLYVLRRGLADGGVSLVPGVVPSDRVRRVATPIDRSTGKLTVDRPWTNAPVSGEAFELHYLDPTNELAVAALAGLNRCFLLDRASVATTGVAAERDITAVAPWITELGQIYEIGYVFPGAFFIEQPVPWWREFLQNGHVWIQAMPDPFPNNLLITARRPATSMVTVGALPTAPQLFATPVVWWITAAQQTTPIRLSTWFAHPFLTGDWITLGQGLDVSLDYTTWQITVIDQFTVSLNGSVGVVDVPATGTPLASATLKMVTNPTSVPQVLATPSPFSDGEEFSSVYFIPANPTEIAFPTLNGLANPYVPGETVRITVTNGIATFLTGDWLVSWNGIHHGGISLIVPATGQVFNADASGAQGTVQLLRPAHVDSTLVSTSDFDTYPVSVDYAAAFGVMALWQRFPYRLSPGAAAGRIPTQVESASEATRQAAMNFNPPPRRQQLSQPFSRWQSLRL